MHASFLKLALAQAELGRGQCSPNPSVGAVAVQAGRVLAVGHHKGPGTPHAEQVVLAQLPKGLLAVTLYVTLEPCNHWGRTPPCVDALIQYGVQQVVYGFVDPNPIVQENKTPDLLREKGIGVRHERLPEIDAFYESYAYWVATKLPWVTVKLAHSLDGMIADEHHQAVALSHQACHDFTHLCRARSDMILTTASTILADDPLLTARGESTIQAKALAILDRQLRVTPDARCLQQAKHSWIFYDKQSQHVVCDTARYTYVDMSSSCVLPSSPPLNPLSRNPSLSSRSPSLSSRAPGTSSRACEGSSDGGIVLTLGDPSQARDGGDARDNRLNLHAVLRYIGELGVHDLWVEAGGQLFTALHSAGWVNRTYLYVTPHVLGPHATPAYLERTIFQRQHSVSWRVFEEDAVLTIEWQGDMHVG